MQQDILESLLHFLQFIFNHLSMILQLTKSNIPIYRHWSTIDREQPFLKPNFKQASLTNHKTKYHQILTEARYMNYLQLCYSHIKMIL